MVGEVGVMCDMHCGGGLSAVVRHQESNPGPTDYKSVNLKSSHDHSRPA